MRTLGMVPNSCALVCSVAYGLPAKVIGLEGEPGRAQDAVQRIQLGIREPAKAVGFLGLARGVQNEVAANGSGGGPLARCGH